MIPFRTAVSVLFGLAPLAAWTAQPSAGIYSVRTPMDVAAQIAYTTVIEPGDGQNTVTVFVQQGQPPEHGTVSYPSLYTGSGQSFSYTPNPGYVGLDSFYFKVTDQDGEFSSGVISINVGNVPAIPGDDDFVVEAGVMSFLDILFTDTGFADPVTFSITQQPSHGSLTIDVPAPLPGPFWQSLIGVFYTPNAGYTGPDQFQYHISDGIDQGTATAALNVSPDTDGDGMLDALDNCPAVVNPGQEDGDGDGPGNDCDNCPAVVNPGQENADGDGLGNACDPDMDNDGVLNGTDNCSLIANNAAGTVANSSPAVAVAQLDANGDGYGNICDADINNTGLVTTSDYTALRNVLNRYYNYSPTAAASDLNGTGTVTTADYTLLRSRLNRPPGPSGLHPNCPPTCP